MRSVTSPDWVMNLKLSLLIKVRYATMLPSQSTFPMSPDESYFRWCTRLEPWQQLLYLWSEHQTAWIMDEIVSQQTIEEKKPEEPRILFASDPRERRRHDSEITTLPLSRTFSRNSYSSALEEESKRVRRVTTGKIEPQTRLPTGFSRIVANSRVSNAEHQCHRYYFPPRRNSKRQYQSHIRTWVAFDPRPGSMSEARNERITRPWPQPGTTKTSTVRKEYFVSSAN